MIMGYAVVIFGYTAVPLDKKDKFGAALFHNSAGNTSGYVTAYTMQNAQK